MTIAEEIYLYISELCMLLEFLGEAAPARCRSEIRHSMKIIGLSLIVVTPAVNFSSLEEVFVVLYTPNAERQQLEQGVLRDQPQQGKGTTE